MKISCFFVFLILYFSPVAPVNAENKFPSHKSSKIRQCVLCHGPKAEKFSPEEAPEIFKDCSLYNHCSVCHGGGLAKGDGKAAYLLYPKPRDFNKGVLKFKSTPKGEPPTDEDIFRIITKGIPGSGMPAFDFFSEEEREALVDHIKTLTGTQKKTPSVLFEIPSPPKVTAKLIKEGKENYLKGGCQSCHGVDGKGNGPLAKILRDDWGNPVLPRDFTTGIFKDGSTPSDIFRTIAAGIDGTPMPSSWKKLTANEIWSISYYIRSLSKERLFQYSPPEIVFIKKTNSDIPLNPSHLFWNTIPKVKVALSPLWQQKERIVFAKVGGIYNEKQIAIFAEWEDKSKDTSFTKNEEFLDAFAIQFPLTENPPSFAMGEKGLPVNIWYWKADKNISENLIAEGIGTVSPRTDAKGNLSVTAGWKDGKWKLLFLQDIFPYENYLPKFEEGKEMFFSIAIWNGSLKERDGQKSVSTWHRLKLIQY